MIVSEKSNIDIAEVTAASPATGAVIASATALLGADLVVVALAWDNRPMGVGGIVTITFLMMISFVAFILVMHQIMRYEYLISLLKLKGSEEKVVKEVSREMIQITKWIRPFHVGGLLFTMLAFWLISYKYLISFPEIGYNGFILLLPFILFFLYWIPKIIGVEREVSVLSRESLIQLIIQVVFLVLICLDFFRIITIP